MKLRLITATRGSSPFWSTAVESIMAAAPNMEHVIICPAARISKMKASQPRARVFAETKTGLYAALNQGLQADGDWDAFTWLNDDDLLSATGFAAVIQKLVRCPDVDFAYGRVNLIDGHGAVAGWLPVARRSRDLRALLTRGVMPLAQPGTVIRRRRAEQLGGFNETYQLAGDLDFFVRALVAESRFAFVNAHVASFRLRAGQLSKRSAEAEREKVEALRPLATGPYSPAVLLRFRCDNLLVYFDRIRRHGWKPMREIYERTH